MRKILFFVALACTFAMAGCSEELKEASFDLYQVAEVTAVGGDGCATVAWTAQEEKPLPLEYLITWTADNPEIPGGSQTTEASVHELLVEDLVNDCAYTFAVQARYENGLSMKVTAVCTPKSTRVAVSDFKAMAGDERVFLSWTAPATELEYVCRVSVSAGDSEINTIEVPSSETSCLVEGLVNGTEYTFALTAVYAHGDSDTVTATATPGEIDPIVVTPAVLRQFQLGTFEFNPAYFVQGEIAAVKWDFDDGMTSEDMTATHLFTETGQYEVSLTVTYDNEKTEQAKVSVTVEPFAWTTASGTGYQKSSNIVFSHDGQTFYTLAQTDKKLLAISAITGEKLWEYATSAATYGAGPAVGPDGTIYFGTEDGDGSFYAVLPSGALKWKVTLGAAVKASPAVTSDGTVYVLADKGNLAALDAASGTAKWSETLDGNAGGVIVDADGTVYAGTSKGIWAFDGTGGLIWKSETAYSVTERGGSLAVAGDVLYAVLKGKGGCVALSTSDGKQLWQYKTTENDCYHPVVDADGTVYFCEKSGYLFAVDKTGNEVWKDATDKNYIYSGFALGADGKAYISQYASPFYLLSFEKDGTRSVVTVIGAQTMSPVSIGPDRRIYYGLNGSVAAYDIKSDLASEGWPVRGYDRQGTNSLK